MQHTANESRHVTRVTKHCNALQRTATHCNTLQRTATHCNALQRTADTVQNTAKMHDLLMHFSMYRTSSSHVNGVPLKKSVTTHCNTLRNTATTHDLLMHSSMYRTSSSHVRGSAVGKIDHNTLRNTAQHCNNTLQHTATHCNNTRPISAFLDVQNEF